MGSLIDLSSSALDLVLLNLLLQVSVFALLVLIVAGLFRKTASARYAILYTGILALPLLSIASVVLNSYERSLVNVPLSSFSNSVYQGFVFEVPAQIPVFDEQILRANYIDNASAAAPEQMPTTEAASAVSSPNFTLINLLAVLWLSGSLLMLYGLVRSLYQIKLLARKSIALTSEQVSVLNSVTAELEFDGDLEFRTSRRVRGPMLAGLVKPVLLLPPALLVALSRQQLKQVLAHELAHVSRKDTLANFVQKLVLAVFWFHPLVHLIDRATDRAREEICDNHVLQSAQAFMYGETLLAVHSMASSLQQNFSQDLNKPQLALGITSLRWKLEKRIEDLLDSSRSHTVKLSTKKQSAILAVTCVSSLVLAGCQLQAAENPTPEQRIAELEQETSQLLQERNALQEQARALQAKLLQSSQEQNRANENFRFRQQVLRSINEIRSLLQAGNQANQFADVAELTSRVLSEIAATSQSQGTVSLSAEARQLLDEIIIGLEANALDRQQLLAEVVDLSSLLDISPRASTVESTTSTRPEPQAYDRKILGQPVYEQIVQIQELLAPADDRQEPDFEAAKQRLDQLMESNFESMNEFEKTTTLAFYTNYWLGIQNYPEAINAFEQMLQIENQRTSTRLRALRSLGQLYAAEERWQESLDNYSAWRELSDTEDAVVFQGLSYGHYQLEDYQSALDFWQQYIELSESNGVSLDREKYAYLNGLYYQLEMFDEALENTKEMVVQFNDATDWQNLRAIYAELDMLDAIEFDQNAIDSAAADLSLPVTIDYTPFVTPLDGEYLPLVATAPQYPRRAAEDGIEGWVLVSFTVDEQGDVISDSVDVVDADPPLIFNRASIRAATQFKFQPRVTDGVGVPVAGVQYLFRYRLRDDA